MTKLIDRVNAIKAELAERRRQDKEAREIREKPLRDAAFKLKMWRANNAIAKIPELVEEAAWKEESRILVMVGVEECDVRFVQRRGDVFEDPKPAGESVLKIFDWCKVEGLKVYLLPEIPKGSITELYRSKNKLYSVWIDL